MQREKLRQFLGRVSLMTLKIIKDSNLAAGAFLEGKVGVFPTDTVWGVGCVLKREE